MILKIFIATWVILYSIFTWLAFSTKSLKVYIAGCVTAFVYFFAASEGVVYAFHRKIPLIGFLMNPFPGNYRLLLLNWHYHWRYFIVIASFSLLMGIILIVFIKKQSPQDHKKHSINAEYIQHPQ